MYCPKKFARVRKEFVKVLKESVHRDNEGGGEGKFTAKRPYSAATVPMSAPIRTVTVAATQVCPEGAAFSAGLDFALVLVVGVTTLAVDEVVLLEMNAVLIR